MEKLRQDKKGKNILASLNINKRKKGLTYIRNISLNHFQFIFMVPGADSHEPPISQEP